eukprot:COSAG02_NODE_4486_length_5301_cov_3.420223_4_plen_101_part_00
MSVGQGEVGAWERRECGVGRVGGLSLRLVSPQSARAMAASRPYECSWAGCDYATAYTSHLTVRTHSALCPSPRPAAGCPLRSDVVHVERIAIAAQPSIRL